MHVFSNWKSRTFCNSLDHIPRATSWEINRDCLPSNTEEDHKLTAAETTPNTAAVALVWSDENEECAKLLKEKGQKLDAVLEQKLDAVFTEEEQTSERLCLEVLPHLKSAVSNDPENLTALLDLAEHQEVPCDNIAAARDNWTQIMNLVEKIHEHTIDDFDKHIYVYVQSYEGLMRTFDWYTLVEEERCETTFDRGSNQYYECLKPTVDEVQTGREALVKRFEVYMSNR